MLHRVKDDNSVKDEMNVVRIVPVGDCLTVLYSATELRLFV